MSCTPTYLAHLIMVECKRELEECQCSLEGDGDDCHAWAQQAVIENKHNGYLADMDELFARWIRRERSYSRLPVRQDQLCAMKKLCITPSASHL